MKKTSKALALHKKLKGKIEIKSKVKLDSAEQLKLLYTPGVGEAASLLANNPNISRGYTIKNNTVAVVSDGSAVLGLGNIGPMGALPVMEGKAMLFKELANVDAFPIVLDTQDSDEIVATVKNIAPVFGGINLEDISAPRCFEIEKRLIDELDIPVVHDDQHATAIVVLAGLINAFKVVKKNLHKARLAVLGAGAAGKATAEFLIKFGVGDVVVVDSKGIISRGRFGLDSSKRELARITNKKNLRGGLNEAVRGADAVIGVSRGNLLNKGHIKSMNQRAVVFALSNPIPEIMPHEAKAGGAVVVATGRSDFPNQINNVLVFPGLFRGALDNKVVKVSVKMRLAAAKNLASLIKRPTANKIIPSALDKKVVPAVASAIK